jgi:hypothetical protein
MDEWISALFENKFCLIQKFWNIADALKNELKVYSLHHIGLSNTLNLSSNIR